MTRGGLRLVSASQFRRLLGGAFAAMGLLTILAFGAGVLAADYLRDLRLSAGGESADRGADLSEKEKAVAMKHLGELSGRLLRLESDAAYLVKKVSHYEQITRQLKDISPGRVFNKQKPERTDGAAAAREGQGQGGALMAPRGCDAVPRDLDLNRIAAVETSIDCFQALFKEMDREVALRGASLMTIPSLQPVQSAHVGSGFGNRIDPFHGGLAFHSGLDFPSPTGTMIYAAAGGRVLSAGWHGPYGNMVEIDHGNGLVTRYAHASKIAVKPGDVVMPGQAVAQIGSTGRSTGPHLHFEVLYRGAFLDPKFFMAMDSMKLAIDDQAQD